MKAISVLVVVTRAVGNSATCACGDFTSMDFAAQNVAESLIIAVYCASGGAVGEEPLQLFNRKRATTGEKSCSLWEGADGAGLTNVKQGRMFRTMILKGKRRSSA